MECMPAVLADRTRLNKDKGHSMVNAMHILMSSCMMFQLQRLPNIAAYAYHDGHLWSSL